MKRKISVLGILLLAQSICIIASAKASVPSTASYNRRDPNLVLDRRAATQASALPFVSTRSAGATLTTQSILDTAGFGVIPGISPFFQTASSVPMHFKTLPSAAVGGKSPGMQPSTK